MDMTLCPLRPSLRSSDICVLAQVGPVRSWPPVSQCGTKMGPMIAGVCFFNYVSLLVSVGVFLVVWWRLPLPRSVNPHALMPRFLH